MAIESFMLPIIAALVKDAPVKQCLCLGYPDLLAIDQWDHIPDSSDSGAIKKWHSWSARVLDTDAFFAALGCDPIYIDRAQIRGHEIVADLNTCDLPRNIGLLIDPGTSEHIFNIGHLFEQIAQSVVVGGYVVHTNPLNMANHGFWNFSLTAYKDFYEANGFTIECALELTGPVASRRIHKIHDNCFSGRHDAALQSSAFIVARKAADVLVNWPCQAKYRANPTLRGTV